MAKAKKFNLDKMVADAQERLAMYINQLVIKAQAETTNDFATLKQKAQ
jgi:hypothetical protein